MQVKDRKNLKHHENNVERDRTMNILFESFKNDNLVAVRYLIHTAKTSRKVQFSDAQLQFLNDSNFKNIVQTAAHRFLPDRMLQAVKGQKDEKGSRCYYQSSRKCFVKLKLRISK
jgi:hypothetical protein